MSSSRIGCRVYGFKPFPDRMQASTELRSTTSFPNLTGSVIVVHIKAHRKSDGTSSISASSNLFLSVNAFTDAANAVHTGTAPSAPFPSPTWTVVASNAPKKNPKTTKTNNKNKLH